MKAKLTKKTIGKLKPKDRTYDVVDENLRGFLIRVEPSGTMSYHVRYKNSEGRWTRHKLGPVNDAIFPVQEARQKAEEVLADVIKGVYPGKKKLNTDAMTLGTFIEEHYGPTRLTMLKSGKATLDRLKANFEAEFWNMPLTDITAKKIEQWRTAKLNKGNKGRKPATLNRDIGSLRAALSMAVEWELLPAHPLASLKPLKESEKPPRFLDKDEERKLFEAIDEREERIRQERDSANEWRRERGYSLYPDLRTVEYADYLKPVVILALNTGLRKGEIFNLEWRDVHFERRQLTVRAENAKSDKSRTLPLNDDALSMLREWRKQTGGFRLVFESPAGGGAFDNINTAWRTVVKDAKLNEHFRFHDLRHTFASWLAMAGVPLNDIRDLLGHANLATTMKYAHLSPDHQHKSIQRLRSWMDDQAEHDESTEADAS